jgi:uncharacterized protein
MPSRRAVVRAVLYGVLALPLWVSAQNRANEPAGPASEAPADRPRTRFGTGPLTVALLLPRQDGPFARAASSLLAGVRAAHARDGSGVVVEAIEVDDQADQLAMTYGELRERSVAMVIGPITRNGVNALVDLGSLGVPTLALNVPDTQGSLPSRLMIFGLAIEAESKQVAAHAFEQARAHAPGRRPRAVAVMVTSPLARRATTAFRDAWNQLGGEMREPVEFAGPRPPRDLRARLGTPAPDVAFLAMGAEQARVLRSALGTETAVWGTSLASIGSGSGLRLPELDGMRLLEMPWQIEPENPAVMAYAKPPTGFNVEMQRLYAFGIDAFRVARQLMAGDTAFELDGVTGRLRFDPGGAPRVERIALPAEYRNGVPVMSPL